MLRARCLAFLAGLLTVTLTAAQAQPPLPAGAEFQVNTYTSGEQEWAEVAIDADGDFVVVWMAGDAAGPDTRDSIQGRSYASDGTPRGGEFQVNTYSTSRQLVPSIAMDAGGDFVVVWYSDGSAGTDTSSNSVLGQRYRASEIFADGFESGDTGAWSVTMPP